MQTADTLSVRIPTGRGNNRITALLAIVALSDFLIFGRTLGLNLFLIAISVTAAVLFLASRRLARRTAALLFAFAALASAPLLEARCSDHCLAEATSRRSRVEGRSRRRDR